MAMVPRLRVFAPGRFWYSDCKIRLRTPAPERGTKLQKKSDKASDKIWSIIVNGNFSSLGWPDW